jgi:hypothetical protein
MNGGEGRNPWLPFSICSGSILAMPRDADLVPIATLTHGSDAALMVKLLQEHGIVTDVKHPARGDGGVLPGLEASALTGFHVLVARSDANRARSCVAASCLADRISLGAVPPPAEETLLDKEHYATHAFRAALFGLVLPILVPLLFYAMYLLLRMRQAPGELSQSARRQARIAMAISGGLLGLIASSCSRRC